MRAAFDELKTLGVGLQLTPGNEPTTDFERDVQASGVPVRTHHGFSFVRRTTQVWSDAGELIACSDSVHPPRTETAAAVHFDAWLERRPTTTVEAMYPGYRLGTGAELERAMSLGINLAVDVSHLLLQRTAGTISSATVARVLDCSTVTEVHVSHNDGRHDSHRLLTEHSFGLDWARERLRAGVPVIYEAYLHVVSSDARRRQIELLRP